MSTYDDTLLAARFAALAPEPLAGDWEDVVARAGRARKGRPRFADPLQTRRRRLLVVLAAVALIVVLGAASAFAVRAVVRAVQGIVGVAPEGATPSSPARGEFVLGFSFGHTDGDQGRFDLSVYADGRVIWRRLGDYFLPVTDEHRNGTGLLERRLTPEGVELVRAEVVSTGLVDRDLDLQGDVEGLHFGRIEFRSGERVVVVTWRDSLDPHWNEANRPTPEQASALIRLDARLSDLASWLPASAWVDAEDKPFVPSGYTVCYQGAKGVGLTGLFALLPPAAARLLRAQENTPRPYTILDGTFARWCSELTNDEARALERILDDAGVSSVKDLMGLAYGAFDVPYVDPTEFSVDFSANRPDEHIKR